ncbi:TetR/AcrR family transcriptional regulator [Aeromicrobium tamlense]
MTKWLRFGGRSRAAPRRAPAGEGAYSTDVPKIIGDSLEEHRATMRRRVFDALVELLRERPFDLITMADLATHAGVGRSSLYNHFKDKEAVVVAFATDETSRYLEQLNASLADRTTPTERLETYVRHHVDTSKDFHIGLGPELRAMLSPESVTAMREHVVAVEQVLRQILIDGVASGEFTVDDVDATVSLLHATLSARHASADTTTRFVLAAVSPS